MQIWKLTQRNQARIGMHACLLMLDKAKLGTMLKGRIAVSVSIDSSASLSARPIFEHVSG